MLASQVRAGRRLRAGGHVTSKTTDSEAPIGSNAPQKNGRSRKREAQAFEKAADEDLLPIIVWVEGKLPEIVDQAEAALMESAEPIFQRGPTLVRPVRRHHPSVRNVTRREAAALSLVPVDHAYLVDVLTRVARWRRFDKRAKEGEELRPCNAPDRVAATYLARSGHWKLQHLSAAISAPTLRPDGSLLQTPGYDEATATWYDPCGIDFPEVPETPTREMAESALQELLWPLRDFPFEDEVDKSVAVVAMLTSVVRRNLPTAPLFGITANAMGSGKTILADSISIIGGGVSAPAIAYPDSDEEAAKSALAILAEGDPVVLIDNIERPLTGDWLCTMLTSETYRARILGVSQMLTVRTGTTWLATGNNLTVAGDLRTRTLLVRLNAHCENPEQRYFDGDLRVWIQRHRPELVVAALTVMRAYIVHGSRPPEMRPWGRFEHWSEMVRAPLMWLGFEDPCASLALLERDDPTRRELLQMMSAWHAIFGSDAVTTRDVIREAAGEVLRADLSEAVQQVAQDRGNLNPKRLGKWLARNADRICEGKQFVRAGERNHVALWRLVTTESTRGGL